MKSRGSHQLIDCSPQSCYRKRLKTSLHNIENLISSLNGLGPCFNKIGHTIHGLGERFRAVKYSVDANRLNLVLLSPAYPS
jgi:hypothetical protein